MTAHRSSGFGYRGTVGRAFMSFWEHFLRGNIKAQVRGWYRDAAVKFFILSATFLMLKQHQNSVEMFQLANAF